MHAAYPHDRETIAALIVVGDLLDRPAAYWDQGRFWYPLDGGWALTISPDSAGRFRLAACYGRTEVGTMWSRSGDWHRLANLVLTLQAEVHVAVGQG